MEEPLDQIPSLVPVVKRKRKERSKPKAKHEAAAGDDQTEPVAGPSKLPAKLEKKSKHGRAPTVEDKEKGQRLRLEGHEKRRRKRAEAKAAEPNEPPNTWDCIPITQNEVSRIPSIWSKDGRFYFTVSHTSIHVHSATAPNFTRLSTLSSTHREGHRKPITAIMISPTNPLQLISGSEDGLIKVWDWVEGRLLRTLTFHDGKVLQLCTGEVLGKWWIFASVSHVKKAKPKQKDGSNITYRVYRVPLGPLPPSEHTPWTLVGKLSSPSVALMVSPRHSYLVALAANKAYTYRLPTTSPDGNKPDDWKPTVVKFISDQNFTCGAFSPEQVIGKGKSSEEWFATGDVRGIIRLWHGLDNAFSQVESLKARGGNEASRAGDTEKRLPTTSLHWHAHAVAAIAFTPSGAQLLSVGEESVLVQWHLASGKREYVPRLGGRPMISLAVKPGTRGVEEEWWMDFSDGTTVRVGAASGTVSNLGQGVRLDPLRPKTETTPYPLSIHPSTSSLVIPSSHPSTIQFVNPLASSVLSDLEVAPSNRVSRRDERELEPVAVEHVTFSEPIDGQSKWMATVEGRKGDEVEGGGLVKNLKLWSWTGDKYMVNTQFPRPHGTSDITSIAFSSAMAGVAGTPYLITSATDGSAKLWQVRQARKSEHGKSAIKKPPAYELFWSTRSTFEYRSMPIHSAAFAPDATIVALAHGGVITLWDVESNALLKTLDGVVEGVCDVGYVGEEGRYLAAIGKKGLAVWDMLTCEVAWSSSQSFSHLWTHHSCCFFIAVHETAAKRTVISVFSPTSPQTLREISIKRVISDICWFPSNNISSLQFVGLSKAGDIYRFGDFAVAPTKPSVKGITEAKIPQRTSSIWQEMFGKDAFLGDISAEVEEPAQAASAIQQKARKSGRPTEVFDGPSHTMPPVSLLFDAFMDELLAVKATSVVEVVRPEESILYDAMPQVVAVDVPVVEERSREVTDEEVKELEVFFREVLGSKPVANSTPAKKPNQPNGHAHAHAHAHDHAYMNGDTISANGDVPFINGGISSSKVTTQLTNGTNHADTDSEEEREPVEESLAPDSGLKSKRGRKRRAPKEKEKEV